MKVRYSPEAFRLQRHGGVARYFAELHAGLSRRQVDSAVLAGLHINRYLHGQPRAWGIDVERLRPRRARQALTKIADPVLLAGWRATLDPRAIYHTTGYADTVPTRNPLVVTVFDLIAERFPADVPNSARESRRKRRWCMAADAVLVISESTRKDLLERVPIPEERVVTTHLGLTRAVPDPRVHPPVAPYLLYVGDRRSRYKNFDLLVRAVAAGRRSGDLTVVCFGEPFRREEGERFGALGVADRFVSAGGDDRVLAAYYARARALVYPSRCEGFGLPLVEAMAQGCPVIAADAGSIPEVAGGAAALIDPDDVEGLTAAIDSVDGDPGVTASRVAAGRRRAAEFDWDRTVSETLAVYRGLDGAE